jgi:hypothetical protein
VKSSGRSRQPASQIRELKTLTLSAFPSCPRHVVDFSLLKGPSDYPKPSIPSMTNKEVGHSGQSRRRAWRKTDMSDENDVRIVTITTHLRGLGLTEEQISLHLAPLRTKQTSSHPPRRKSGRLRSVSYFLPASRKCSFSDS